MKKTKRKKRKKIKKIKINRYLDDRVALKLDFPARPMEHDIVNTMLSVNKAMQMSKAYNNI